MSLDFVKEAFFRYIFPTSLLWSGLYVLGEKSVAQGNEIWLFFLATGFLINTVGGVIIRLISKKCIWYEPENELIYWKKLAAENELVTKRIDRRWDAYVTYINSTIAVCALGVYYIGTLLKIEFLETYEYIFQLIAFLSILVILVKLVIHGFRSTRTFGEKIGEQNNKRNQY